MLCLTRLMLEELSKLLHEYSSSLSHCPRGDAGFSHLLSSTLVTENSGFELRELKDRLTFVLQLPLTFRQPAGTSNLTNSPQTNPQRVTVTAFCRSAQSHGMELNFWPHHSSKRWVSWTLLYFWSFVCFYVVFQSCVNGTGCKNLPDLRSALGIPSKSTLMLLSPGQAPIPIPEVQAIDASNLGYSKFIYFFTVLVQVHCFTVHLQAYHFCHLMRTAINSRHVIYPCA